MSETKMESTKDALHLSVPTCRDRYSDLHTQALHTEGRMLYAAR